MNTQQVRAFTTSERAIISLIADAVDRRVELNGLYSGAEGATLKVKLATEIRLIDGSIERLLRKISTTIPAPASARDSIRTVNARRAANARWSHAD